MRGLLAALLLCGCAADPIQWMKDGFPGGPRSIRGQLETDTFICERWSSNWTNPRGVDPTDFHACMVAQGWEPMNNPPPSGPLAGQ